jgi:hypothetical protein
MATPGAPHATIDWASAEVRDGELVLPLDGWLSGTWLGHITDLVKQLPPSEDGLTISVTAEQIRVAPIRRGAAPAVHQLVDQLVAQTNATFATAEDEWRGLERQRRGRLREVAMSLALIALALTAVALQWADWTVPIRAIVVMAFIVIAPGSALLRLWGLADGWAGTGLAIALSLSMAMVLAGATVYAGIWSPLGALCGLAGITVLAAVASMARVRRHPRPAAGLVRP